MADLLEGLSYSAQAYYILAIMAESTRTPRPRDPNQLAKLITDIATGDTTDRLLTDDGRDLAAVMMGRLGGLKGGPARAEALNADQRREIARRGAEARWGKRK